MLTAYFLLALHSAHYIVLHDDIFNGNMQKYYCCQCHFFPTIVDVLFIYFRIQELAFTLCHVYAKATRSVSIPAPVYCEFWLILILIDLRFDFF